MLPLRPILGKIGKMTFILAGWHSEMGRNMAVTIQKYLIALL